MDSSLRAYDRIADRIKLHRQVDSRSTIVVEGPSDRRLITDLIPNEAVVVFVGGTRDEVLRTANDLVRLEIDRAACLVDRDFDAAVGLAITAGHPLVTYDGADLEDMLMASPAAPRMLGELASEAKLEQYGGVESLLQAARREGVTIARLRRLNAENGWSLAFGSVDLSAKINRTTLELDVVGMCMALRATWDGDVSQGDLEHAACAGDSGVCPRTSRPLVRGRDLLVVIGVALRALIGSRTKAQTAPDLLEGILRSSADRDWLRGSSWFGELTRVAMIPDC